MFKIQIPLTKYEWLNKYFSLNLKNRLNFYGGYNCIDWNKYGGFSNSNGRAYDASFSKLDDLLKSMEYIEEKGESFSFVFNIIPTIANDSLIDKNIDFINNVIKPKSIIMNDLNFAGRINKNINIHISTIAGINNSESFIYWLNNVPNINRLIFPREFMIKDIDKLSSKIDKKNMDYEIIVKNSCCYLSNSHCGSSHDQIVGQKHLCYREREGKNFYGKLKKEKIQKLYDMRLKCKVCQIYNFKDKFLNSKNCNMYLKIAGRENKINGLLKDVKFVDEVIVNCKKAESYKEFIFLNILKHKVIYGYTCFYKKCKFYKELKV